MVLNIETNTDRKLFKIGLPIKTIKMFILKISLTFFQKSLGPNKQQK